MTKGALAILVHGGTENWSPVRWKARFNEVCSDRRVLLLLLAYRSWKIPLLGALPLASAGIAGLASLVLLFGDRVHGITIAFGFTLIGVVQDYPIHFFSQQRAFGPCTPGFTYVNDRHCPSRMQASRHSPGFACGRSKFAKS